MILAHLISFDSSSKCCVCYSIEFHRNLYRVTYIIKIMSWNPYCDKLVKTNVAEQVSIWGLDGKKWGNSAGCQHGDAEGKLVADAMKSNQFDGFRAAGPKFSGVKHMFLNGADGTCSFKAGKGGAIAMKTKTGFFLCSWVRCFSDFDIMYRLRGKFIRCAANLLNLFRCFFLSFIC